MPEAVPKSGQCAIIGRPNVGKSTLLNALLGQKLAIATHKPQTTRTNLLGVCVREEPPTQIAFVDTPGVHRPHNALGRAIVENAKASLPGTDVVLLLTEVGAKTRPEDLLLGDDSEVMATARKCEQPVVLGINKIDRLHRRSELLPILAIAEQRGTFAGIVPLCAQRGTNVGQLIDELRKHLPEGLAYDPDQLTDKPERFFAAELIREATMVQTQKEVPYSVAVLIDRYEDEPALTRIAATIVVSREGHKGIVIGKGGQRLKSIGTDARTGIEALIERKVFLELWVKVMPDWTNDPRRVRELTGQES